MARKIESPTKVAAVGEPPKTILEFVGGVNTGDSAVSIARMSSPEGWREPGQTPAFDEYTIVLSGTLVVETKGETLEIAAGQAVHTPKGEWIRYSTPHAGGAEYIAVCVPAFTPDTVHRDAE